MDILVVIADIVGMMLAITILLLLYYIVLNATSVEIMDTKQLHVDLERIYLLLKIVE